MKKAIVLLLALTLIGGAVFAQDAAPYKLTGDASLKWGMNLDTKDSGFQNDANFAIEFPIAAGVTTTTGGEGVYGMIEIKDINLSVKDSKDDGIQTLNENADGDSFDITAKIIAGPAFFKIYTTPSFTFTNASYIEPYSKDVYDDFSSSKKSLVRPTQDLKGGMSAGYNFGTFGSAEVRVASIGDWGASKAAAATYKVVIADEAIPLADALLAGHLTMLGVAPGTDIAVGQAYLAVDTKASAASGDNKYLVGFNTTLTPIEMLKVNFGAMYNVDAKYLGLTAKITLTPVTGVTVIGAMDGYKVDTAGMIYDIYGKVAYAFNEAKDSFAVEAYYAEGAAYSANPRMDLAAKFADASGFVPGLAIDLGVFYSDMLHDPAFDPLKLAIAEKVSYKFALEGTNYVKPYEKYATDMNLKAGYLSIGVEAALIANTVFTLDYTAGKITDDVVGNAFVSGLNENLGKGVISFKAKITL